MRQRLLFIIVFVIGLGIGTNYFIDFLGSHQLSLRVVPPYMPWLTIVLIAVAIGLQLIGHVLRAYKSGLLLERIRPVRTRTLFNGLSVGYLFNTLLPFRLGEVVRAFYVGDAIAISKGTVFLSIIIERSVDSLVLSIAFLSAGLLIHSVSAVAAGLLLKFSVVVFGLCVVLVLLLTLVRSENKRFLQSIYRFTSIFNPYIQNRLRFTAWSGIYSVRLMLGSRRVLRKYIAYSVVMWAMYFGSTACVALALLKSIQGSKLWFITQSVYAGVSAPAGPGYIGSFHLIVQRLLSEIGFHQAGSFTSIMWLIIIAPITIIAIVVLIWRRYQPATVPSPQAMLINKLHRESDVSRELGHFLDAYLQGEKINQIMTQAELDNKFNLIKSFKGGSNAHTMLVWQNEELRVKKITLPQYGDKLKAQADWLNSRAHLPHLPRVVDEDETKDYYYFDLAYHETYTPFFEYIHSNTTKSSYDIVRQVIKFLQTSVYTPAVSVNGRDNLGNYIENKVLGKVRDTAALNSVVNRLTTNDKIKVNGSNYLNIVTVIERIIANESAMGDLSKYKESPIHGDLTIDNLIVSPEGDFMVLDPNNENQVSAPVVDYGKMYQSLHSGYEFLIQLERCEAGTDDIHFEEAKSQKYAALFKLLDEQLKISLKPAEYRTILFHEAVHYCRMLTYRASINPDTLPAFYGIAVRLFNQFLRQYEK